METGFLRLGSLSRLRRLPRYCSPGLRKAKGRPFQADEGARAPKNPRCTHAQEKAWILLTNLLDGASLSDTPDRYPAVLATTAIHSIKVQL
jgi:hypothetical protein